MIVSVRLGRLMSLTLPRYGMFCVSNTDYVEVVRDEKLLAESFQMRSIKEIEIEKASFQVSWHGVCRITIFP
jgi:hypothetical protein